MRTTFLAVFFLNLYAPIAVAHSSWIVTGNDVSYSVSSKFAAKALNGSQSEGSFAVTRSANGMSVVELDDAAERFLQKNVHNEFHRCGGYTFHPNEASARAELNNPFYAPSYLNRSGLFPTSADQQDSVTPALALVDKSNILGTINMLQALGTRHYQSESGETAATQLKSQWESYGSGRNDYSVELFSHSWRQSSVIATITGSDEPEKTVVLGGHLDSINASDNSNAPGADDDASGIAVVSEALRVILASDFRPKNLSNSLRMPPRKLDCAVPMKLQQVLLQTRILTSLLRYSLT